MKDAESNLPTVAQKPNLVIDQPILTDMYIYTFLLICLVNCHTGFEMGDHGRCRGMNLLSMENG